MRYLGKKEKMELEKEIFDKWGAKIDFEAVYVTGEDRLWLVTRQAAEVDKKGMRVESIGNYFARRDKNGVLRLSIEGSQIIGPLATKNVVEIDDKQAWYWVRGLNLDVKTGINAYAILKNGKDFIGCGKTYDKGVLNHVPKERRIKKL